MKRVCLLLFLPLVAFALTSYEERIITNRWNNTAWLWCDLIEITIKNYAAQSGFRIPDQENADLTVLWEKNLPEDEFEAVFPRNGTFAAIGYRRYETFKTGMCQLYSTKQKLINLVAEKFANTMDDKLMILRYSKELNLSGTVTLLRKVFIHRSLKDWLEIEANFQDQEFLAHKTTRNGRGCHPYLPKLPEVYNSQSTKVSFPIP